MAVAIGIRSLEDIREILNAGADKISLNSAAVKDPELVRRASEKFGSQCVVVAIDVRGRKGGQIRIAGVDADFKGIDENASEEDNSKFPSGYEVVVAGGTKATGLDALEWAKKVEELGAGEILLTSLDRDGTKSGFDNVITRMIADAVSIPVIASGGAGKMEDFYDGIIDGGADAVLAASLFHFGEIKIEDQQCRRDLRWKLHTGAAGRLLRRTEPHASDIRNREILLSAQHR